MVTTKSEEDGMKIVCRYHLKNFEKLTETQKKMLFDHHSKSILIGYNTYTYIY
jgi:hypothetical protein